MTQGAQGAEKSAALHSALRAWYEHARRDLPWRRGHDPYAIWLSEVMLQQTRVETVIPYYNRFLQEFPTVMALAEAPLDRVLEHWSGLGYYRRARMLHEGARVIAARGVFPKEVAELRDVPGIGPYTAGAVASIAFGQRAALVDGNVARVLARLFALDHDIRGGAGLARVWKLADVLVAEDDPGGWNQALMELGSTVCTVRDPRCLLCPVAPLCEAKARGVEKNLPILSPKPRPRSVREVALVASSGDAVLLARRCPNGLFGGLWEPPLLEMETDLEEARQAAVVLASAFGVELTSIEDRGTITHTLSHRRMRVEVMWGQARSLGELRCGLSIYDKAERVPWTELSGRGRSSLASKILGALPRQTGYSRGPSVS
ncbi:MAG: A/G-specific adenine glycosylase [Myxococcales bacterium]